MSTNYTAIIQQNLDRCFSMDLEARADAMGAQRDENELRMRAFGQDCVIHPNAIRLAGTLEEGPLGIILSLYALHATAAPIEIEPLKAFKEFPDSMPYVGAFASHTEAILTTAVDTIIDRRDAIMDALDGAAAPQHVSGDSAMLVRPLPKIALCYIFYASDEDFPASATCLFSSNANCHMPMDGLADVGEYTSRKIVDWVNET